MSSRDIYDTALYLRLSREDNASEAGMHIDGSKRTESNSISSQRDILRAYVQNHDDLRIFDIYIEMKIAYLVQFDRMNILKKAEIKAFGTYLHDRES